MNAVRHSNTGLPSPRTTLIPSLLLAAALGAVPPRAAAFCGFYVAQGEADLFNQASKVVIARSGERTVMTMVSDFRGDPKEFAVVIPVPVVLTKDQVHIGDPAWVDHLEQFSVPRLVEYFDPSPCPRKDGLASQAPMHLRGGTVAMGLMSIATKARGTVKVLEQYKVDEYEIVILSAEDGRGLESWLARNRYRVPTGASRVLNSYIRQGMFFFVAKVDAEEMRRRGSPFLRPIQVAYESPKFMLPIRLGMVNANGPQEMFVLTLTRNGRVEPTNYRMVRVPTGDDVPEFVKKDFGDFYRFVFARTHRAEREEAVFLEYAWTVQPNRPTCDPCTAPYLTPEELRSLGAFWISANGPITGEVVLTRLHLRYSATRFPEDLQLHETGDRENWQARYVIRHPYRGPDECPELVPYRRTVWARREKEAKNYAELTGFSLEATRNKMGVLEDWSEPDEAPEWWKRIWR